jgi:hypothetical protein
MSILLSANDYSILQSTTYIFTPFDFGNTVCSQQPASIHWKTKGVNMYVVDCKIEESLADNNINIYITKTLSVNVCC